MASTNKLYNLPANGSNAGTWDQPVNENFELIDSNLGGTFTQALASTTPVNIAEADAQNVRIKLTGTLTANISLRLPTTLQGFWVIDNQTTGNFTVSLRTTAGGSTGLDVEQGYRTFVFSDGTDVFAADDSPQTAIAASGVTVSAITGMTAGGVTPDDAQEALEFLNARRLYPGTIFAWSGPSTTLPTGMRALVCDGSAVNRTTYSDLYTALNGGFSATAVAIDIATSTFTKVDHGLRDGMLVRLATTNTLPTPLNTTTDYVVERLTADTFKLKTPANKYIDVSTTITLSGSQLGTHTFTRSMYGSGNGTTTFNVPDFQGVFLRGYEQAATLDALRGNGTFELDAYENHSHTATTNTNTSIASNGDHNHTFKFTDSNRDAGASAAVTNITTGGGGTTVNTSTDGAHTHTATSTSTTTVATSTTGDTETRPINATVIWCIAY